MRRKKQSARRNRRIKTRRKGNKMSDRKQMIIKALKTAISCITAIGDDEYDDILDNGGKPNETIENMKIIIRTLSE